MAVPAARRARDGLHHRPAPGLSHAVRSAREDQLREDGKDRAARASGELGHRERGCAPEAAGVEADYPGVRERRRLTAERAENAETISHGARRNAKTRTRRDRATARTSLR